MKGNLLIAALVTVVTAAIASQAQAGYVQEVMADSPAAYWRFDDGDPGDLMATGAAAADTVGVNGGSYQNGVPLVAGAIPGTAAADFDGAMNYVTTTTLGNFGSAMGSGLSIEFWVKTTETRTIRQAMGVLNQANGTALVVDFNRMSNLAPDPDANRFNYYLRASDNKALSTHTRQDNYNDGNWHHMAWVVDNPASGNTAHIYFDGVEVSQGKVASSPSNFADFQFPFMIGANNNRGTAAAHVDAVIDEVALYDHPLSAGRIAAHYGAGNAPVLPVSGDLLMHLDGDVVTTDTSGHVAAWNDLSGRGNQAVQNVNAALRPTPLPGALNGHQTLDFEVEDIMDVNTLTIGPEATILMVTQNSTQSTSTASIHRTVMAPRNNNPEPYSPAGNGYALGYFREGANGFNVSLGNGSAEQKVSQSLAADNQFEIITYRHSGTTGELLRNAVPVNSGPQTRISDFATGYSIGREAGNGVRGYQGQIAEIIVYDRALTPDEYHQVGFYLDQKYGLGTPAYRLRADLDYRNHTSRQVWQDAGLLNNDGILGTSGADTNMDPVPALKGYRFSGNQQITIPHSPSLSVGDTSAGEDFTVEMWVNAADVPSGQTVLLETRDSSWHGFGLLTTDSELRMYFNSTGGSAATLGAGGGALTEENEFEHVALVFDADPGGTGTASFYLNGQLVGSDTYSGLVGSLDGGGDFLLGHGRPGTSWLPFDGQIALFRLQARALSAAEVLASYQQDYGYFIPEPGSMTLLALGFGLLAGVVLRRRRVLRP
jgi:hypothetical protein